MGIEDEELLSTTVPVSAEHAERTRTLRRSGVEKYCRMGKEEREQKGSIRVAD